jgi:predicted nucleic acid-binding protein
MIYFDTDVLVHYHVIQDVTKHQQAKTLLDTATQSGRLFVSLLALQELAYVLAKLQTDRQTILVKVGSYYRLAPAPFGLNHYQRAVALANLIGFQHISDCLHTAIAETYCTELYTYNQSDFKRIQPHTSLSITIL